MERYRQNYYVYYKSHEETNRRRHQSRLTAPAMIACIALSLATALVGSGAANAAPVTLNPLKGISSAIDSAL